MFLLVAAFFVACLSRHGIMHPSESDLKRFLSTKRTLPLQVIDEDLPSSFDVRTKYPGCTHPVLDQGDCGSCWAFASTETLSDRFCVASNGTVNVTLSPQNALQCETLHYGCVMGSMPEWAWPFLVKHGVASLACMPYVSGDGNVPGKCEKRCADGSAVPRYYRAANYSHAGDFINAHKHTAAIMRALLSGPLDATFIVYGDFDNYVTGTVYQHKSGGFEGLHSVKIVGYGVQDNVPYWTVQNSWGTDWGDNGFFKIIRGVDDCMFESQVYFGFPDLK